jgi:hypothetical protein
VKRLLPCLLVLAACGAPTEVVVHVESAGISIPTELDRLRIVVTNPTSSTDDGGTVAYESPLVQLCDPVAPVQPCNDLPLTLTLVPGHADPSAPVRVEVQGYAPGDQMPSTTDAAVFAFVSGTRQDLDFALRSVCLGVQCAAANAACDESGGCTAIVPGGTTTPDLAPPALLSVHRIAGGGLVQSGETATSTAFPPVQPGDLLITAFVFPATLTPLLDPSWVPLHTSSTDSFLTTGLYYRFADGSALDRVATYGSAAGTGTFDWVFLAYRNAGAPMLLFGESITNDNLVLPAANVPAGDAFVGLIDTESTCTQLGTDTVYIDQVWAIFERLAPVMSPTMQFGVDPNSCAASTAPSKFELVLPPP